VRLALALVTAATAAACLRSPSYQCQTSAQCASGGVTGRCESNGYCSLPDPSCGDGSLHARQLTRNIGLEGLRRIANDNGLLRRKLVAGEYESAPGASRQQGTAA